jgi:hypothetical protein
MTESDSGFYDNVPSSSCAELEPWQKNMLQIWYDNNRCAAHDADIARFRDLFKAEGKVVEAMLRRMYETENMNIGHFGSSWQTEAVHMSNSMHFPNVQSELPSLAGGAESETHWHCAQFHRRVMGHLSLTRIRASMILTVTMTERTPCNPSSIQGHVRQRQVSCLRIMLSQTTAASQVTSKMLFSRIGRPFSKATLSHTPVRNQNNGKLYHEAFQNGSSHTSVPATRKYVDSVIDERLQMVNTHVHWDADDASDQPRTSFGTKRSSILNNSGFVWNAGTWLLLPRHIFLPERTKWSST